jgi:uncharacterized protein YdiU (UPF0061 family)
MPVSSNYVADRRFSALGEGFADAVRPCAFPQHVLRFRNQDWARKVGLGELTEEEWEHHFARFEPLPQNLPEPLAIRYHGHQFDVYNPDLGDGRGFLFAQVRDGFGRLLDLGTKGSGRTPYSRSADGRLTLKGGIREVLATEMLEALGVNTSKSFSLFETGEQLMRGDEPSPTRSSVLVRLSHSHLRIGCFERQAYEANVAGVRALAEYSMQYLLPEIRSHEQGPLALLREVTRRSAQLCAQWMVAGFVHGVLNSDNMTVTGESFDYGPYRFLPHYDPSFTAAYFDQGGLYAFSRQPRAVFRNLQRLARSLAILDPVAPWERGLDGFMNEFERTRAAALVSRLGLLPADPDADESLAKACWDFLAKRHVGYDRFMFDWWGGPASTERALAGACSAAYGSADFLPLRNLLETRQPADPARLELAYFQGSAPCSLLIGEIEAIWSDIAERDDFAAFDAKIAETRQMKAALGLAREG